MWTDEESGVKETRTKQSLQPLHFVVVDAVYMNVSSAAAGETKAPPVRWLSIGR